MKTAVPIKLKINKYDVRLIKKETYKAISHPK